MNTDFHDVAVRFRLIRTTTEGVTLLTDEGRVWVDDIKHGPMALTDTLTFSASSVNQGPYLIYCHFYPSMTNIVFLIEMEVRILLYR